MVLIIQFRILSLLLAAAVAANPAGLTCPRFSGTVSAEACVLMAADGQCLFEQNADSRRLIASTTKLMTALVCLENADEQDVVTIRERHCLAEGSSMYLKPGERYTVRELLLGLLLSSGNDAALALADHVGGSMEGFVGLMNRRASQLGLTQTHFENPHGLDAAEHFSTARDLARLMLCCMENPSFRRLVSARTAEIRGLTLVNHNRLLSLCPDCIGGKTGYTMAAGRCLVSCFERDGLRLVCVTLSDPDDWNDHRRLSDWAFRTFVLRDPAAAAEFDVPVVTGSRAAVRVMSIESRPLLLPRDAEIELQAELPRFVFAPVKRGESAGTLRVYSLGKLMLECPLIYADDVPLASPVFQQAG